MANFSTTPFEGCFLFRFDARFEDHRGVTVKPLHLDFLRTKGVDFECRESFISFSKKNVVRGMHFQVSPHDHDKLVSCLNGEIFDVVVDLRRHSKTAGQAFSVHLKGESGECLYIPKGCAHGFQVLSDSGAWVAYYTSLERYPESERSIHWQSIPIEWPIKNPIVSDRDNQAPIIDFNLLYDFAL